MRETPGSTSESVARAQEEWAAARDRQVADAAAARARAEKLWWRFEAADPEGRRELVLGDPEFRSWAFCEKLCNESVDLAEDGAGEALGLVELALDLVPAVSGDKHLISGLQEYIWKHFGNVFRAGGDLKKAREAFERAREYFIEGITGSLPSLILRDRLAALEAAVLRDQGQLAEALKKIDDAARSSVGDRSFKPELFLEKARLHRQLDEPQKALEALASADRKAEGLGAPLRLRLAIERGGILCDLGRHGEVQKIDAGLRKAAESLPLDRARLLCLEGRVAAGLGRLEEANALLQKAQGGSPGRAIPDLALLALEIGALHARQGQTTELKSLAEETLRLTEKPDLNREAAATLKLFCRLAAQEKLSAERAEHFVRDFSRVAAKR